MSGSKHFDRIAVIATALMLVLTGLFMNGTAWGLEMTEHTMGYEERLFDATKVHDLDIVMNDWEDLIQNAVSEEYYPATVVIDGESYKNVGIRAKGNTSLSTVATLGSERYSFKIEFDHYDKSKSYYGLDKLSLNNLIQDSTMMKDYLTYTMMQAFAVCSSLCSYVSITVNGEAWGLYLAVEGVEEAFLERNYGSDYGELYKPDSQSGGERENGGDLARIPDVEAGALDGSGMGSSDVKLQYIDDDLSSYSNIWSNAKTDICTSDQTRLVEALKRLSNQESLSDTVDVEQVIRYFVVHNYVCNGDSYTGSMVHNYYLYEKDGRLSMIPWDYNLAFGTFQGNDATGTVNTPIDSPVENGSGEDRPMWNWIVSNEEYTDLYHQYYAEFLNNVDAGAIIDSAYEMIRDYVKKDPTAFYSYEEFEVGVATLRQFCSLRSESISMQLENSETVNRMTYADASGITLSDMGTMNDNTAGGFGDAGNGNMPELGGTRPEDQTGEAGAAPSPGESPSAPGGDAPSGGIPGQNGGDFSGGDIFNGDPPSGIPNAGENGMGFPTGGDMQKPDGFANATGAGANASDQEAWIWLAVSVAVLGIGLIIAKRFRA